MGKAIPVKKGVVVDFCLMNKSVQVDLFQFAALSLGFEFPAPNSEVQKRWVVFEGMIALMTPQGFADLMDNLMPHMIGDVVPLVMQPMIDYLRGRKSAA